MGDPYSEEVVESMRLSRASDEAMRFAWGDDPAISDPPPDQRADR